MNTPSHAILNLVLLDRAQNHPWPVLLGSVLPDLPIFAFYGLQRWVYGQPSNKIWSEIYFQPFWQDVVAIAHSMPLALVGWAIARSQNHSGGELLCLSLLLHSLLDLPVHSEDAHRHFWPLTDYRFFSPLSYWDPRHYGQWVALAEALLVLGAMVLLWRGAAPAGRVLLAVVNALYAVAYVRFYVLTGA